MKKPPQTIGYMWMDQGLDYKAMLDTTPDECAKLCSLRYHENEVAKRDKDLNLLMALNNQSDDQIRQWSDYHGLLALKTYLNNQRDEAKNYIKPFMEKHCGDMETYLIEEDDRYTVESLAHFFLDTELMQGTNMTANYLQYFLHEEINFEFYDHREILQRLFKMRRTTDYDEGTSTTMEISMIHINIS